MIRLSMAGGKFRPVQLFTSRLIFDLFQKNLNLYYLFNVLIQSLNTCLVALLLNLFLQSVFLSFSFSLFYGLSRFSFYDMTQLFCGGALEGLAVTFFLLSLFFILRALMDGKRNPRTIYTSFLWSILFANLSICTHERYIVLFPFILVVALFSAARQMLTNRQKALATILIVVSVLLNVAIKKYVYATPFFVGTGGTNITFSLTSAFTFLADAVMSIAQINSKPEYLTGLPFAALATPEKAIILSLLCGILPIFFAYLWRVRKVFELNDEPEKNRFFIFLILGLLFALCLLPAIVTIRLEQRWLQASFCIFILMVTIALCSLLPRMNALKGVAFACSAAFFLWPNYYYLKNGANNLYMKSAENSAALLANAIKNGSIHQNTNTIYLLEKKKDENANNALNWAIADGYLFNFYQGKSKKIIYIDSVSTRSGNPLLNPLLIDFNKDSSQILYAKNSILDITASYLKDSLKNFKY